MNGRFPSDIFIIIVVPFFTIAMGVFLPALLMPTHVHHRRAVTIAIAIAVVTLIGLAILWRRRRKAKG